MRRKVESRLRKAEKASPLELDRRKVVRNQDARSARAARAAAARALAEAARGSDVRRRE